MPVLVLVALTVIVTLLVVVILIRVPVAVLIIFVSMLPTFPRWRLCVTPLRSILMMAAVIPTWQAWWGNPRRECVWVGWVLVLVMVGVRFSMGWIV